MSSNRAVIYSNGIADFRRSYEVQGSLRVAIPVKQDHVADVLASLHVLGDVTLSSPPTFRPSNEAAGALQLNPDHVLAGLAKSLGGAEVEVRRAGETVTGVLTGLHTHRESNGGAAYDVESLVVLSDGQLRRVPLNDVESLQFQDDVIQAELDKALQRQVQRIKPNSTFVEFELKSESSAEALVQYTVPAAAWKITYRLRSLEEDQFELQGYAVVDNNTDEDWRDFHLAVVTGEPITFSTDLADSKTPQRRHVDVVRDEALGSIELEAAMGVGGVAADNDDDGQIMARKSAARYESMAAFDADRREVTRSAQMSAAEVHESGDFCVYQAQTPVSIDSNRSAVLPVFQVTLDKSRSVLHYKQSNHASRPYRSIEFTNETEHSLGRGVCTVFEAGVYGGSCIMPANKPGEESLLPHALETGVLVRVESPRRQQRQTAIHISDGLLRRQIASKQVRRYRIASSRDEMLRFYVDHVRTLRDSEIEATLRTESGEETLDVSQLLTDGIRLRFGLEAKASVVVSVTEINVQTSEVRIAGPNGVGWLRENIIRQEGPLSNTQALKDCLAIQEVIDVKEREIEAAQQEMQQLADRQERLRKNVAAGGNAQQSSQWLAALATAEERLVELEEKRIPALRTEKAEIEQRLYDALKALDVQWKE